MQATTIPTGWRHRRLRFDIRANPKKAELNLDDETEISFVSMDAVGELGGLRLDTTRALADVYKDYTYFADGDVCVARITPCFENGKGALAAGLANGIGFGTTELHVLRPKDELDRKFLFYITISHDFRGFGEAEMLGAGGQKRVPERFIKDWRAPLPDLATQKRIAAYLDDKTARIDALIEKKRALLDRLAEKRQALITRAVTRGLNPDTPLKDSGSEWLGEIPVHWSVRPLKWRVRIQSGQVDPVADEYKDLPLIAPDHIEQRTGRIIEVKTADEQSAMSGKYLCAPTSVLYSKIRPALRKAAVFGQECLCSADMYALNPGEEVERDFLLFFLLTEAFSAYAELSSLRVAMPKVNREALGAVEICIPPLDEQREIARLCNAENEKHLTAIDEVAKSVDRLIEYRAALVTAAVTGKIETLLTDDATETAMEVT